MTLTADEKPQFDADLSVYLPLQGSFRGLSVQRADERAESALTIGVSKVCPRCV